MSAVTFTKLRNNAKKYFDMVEKGETLEIYRNGKPSAILAPARTDPCRRWKHSAVRRIRGAALARAVIQNRREGRA
ncbi:MAG: type II toxin-antitoxin system Phd/YefM family antitoxin [bacterium]